MQKVALKYHRFSDKDQSHGSLERQDIITSHWCNNNNVTVADTFNDDGYSAKNFDRPDIKKLFEFIRTQKNKIDYLVVAELTRFSRELGDAINMVKKIQTQYGIQIVSSGRNSIYDVKDATSFFMMSIEFTLGNTDNLQRETNINGGIFTAKKEGRYIGSRPPFGYCKTGEGKEKKLVILPNEAKAIRFIFKAFLDGMPINEIRKQAKEMGYNKTGRSVIQENVLANPIYNGKQRVKNWKDQAGGIFPANHEAIIDDLTWGNVQRKLEKPKKKGITVHDEMPLRGVLHCHCGDLLTGAPSRNSYGNYYYYYKCNFKSAHNNISVIKAHAQLEEMLSLMSLPQWMIDAVGEQSKILLSQQRKDQNKEIMKLRTELMQVEADLHSVEEKYLRNSVSIDTYSRWFQDCTSKKQWISAKINNLSSKENQLNLLLQDNIQDLSDLNYIYKSATTTNKQTLLKQLFDNTLYYRNGTYRTKNLMNIFSHNNLILKQKQLLEIDEKPDFANEIRCGGADRTRTGVQTNSPQAFYMFIYVLIVGKRQEHNKPTFSLEE